MRVALFITCLTDTFYPRVGIALARLLRHVGCEVAFPSAQTCCGQPAYNSGYHREAAALARRMAEVFRDAEYVVTPSGSCAAMVKQHAPQLLADDPAAADLARRTWEATSFLQTHFDLTLAGLPAPDDERFTFHYPCHCRPLFDVATALERVRGARGFVPAARAEQCCGFGGVFAVKHDAVSAALLDEKLDALAATGATLVVCNEGGCGLHLEGGARRRGMRLRFVHALELMAERLGLMEPNDDA